MRHDLVFFRDVDLSRQAVDPRALTLPPWCLWKATASQPPPSSECGTLRPPPTGGVLDSLFMGGQTLLEYMFGSLQLARLRGLRVADGTRPTDKLAVPDRLIRPDGTHTGPEVKIGYLHYALEAHLGQLGVRERGLLRTHSRCVELVHFARYQVRHMRLDVGPELERAGARLCDGRQRLCIASPGAARGRRPRGGRARNTSWRENVIGKPPVQLVHK